jgi:hypothetical protein
MPPVYFRCGHHAENGIPYQIRGEHSRLDMPPTAPPDPLRTLDEGILLFNESRYFEAHEAFEDLWRVSTGDLRLVYQGVVQACAGLVKHQRGQNEPALTLLRKGLAKLQAGPVSGSCGFDVASLIEALRGVIDALQARLPFAPPAMHRSHDL